MTAEWCVIFNPAAGKRRARRRLDRWRQLLAGRAEFRATEHPGHARQLAHDAALEGFAGVAAAGGDGTVHEVLNGLMTAARQDVRMGLLPVGSANDFAFSLDVQNRSSPDLRQIDVGCMQAVGGQRQVYFGCCTGIGFNAYVTLESRRSKRLQGVLLYGMAALRALRRHYQSPEMEIQIDEEPPWRTPTLLISVLNGRREGNFPLAPQANLEDGFLNFVHAGPLTRFEIVKLLPRLSIAGPPQDYPGIRQGLCQRMVVRSSQPLISHVDGEFFCLPEENVCEIEVSVRRRALLVDLTLARL